MPNYACEDIRVVGLPKVKVVRDPRFTKKFREMQLLFTFVRYGEEDVKPSSKELNVYGLVGHVLKDEKSVELKEASVRKTMNQFSEFGVDLRNFNFHLRSDNSGKGRGFLDRIESDVSNQLVELHL